jgi:hypothetical protein
VSSFKNKAHKSSADLESHKTARKSYIQQFVPLYPHTESIQPHCDKILAVVRKHLMIVIQYVTGVL